MSCRSSFLHGAEAVSAHPRIGGAREPLPCLACKRETGACALLFRDSGLRLAGRAADRPTVAGETRSWRAARLLRFGPRPAISECRCVTLAGCGLLSVPMPERSQGFGTGYRRDGRPEGRVGVTAHARTRPGRDERRAVAVAGCSPSADRLVPCLTSVVSRLPWRCWPLTEQGIDQEVPEPALVCVSAPASFVDEGAVGAGGGDRPDDVGGLGLGEPLA